MNLRPEEISAVIKEQIKNYKNHVYLYSALFLDFGFFVD